MRTQLICLVILVVTGTGFAQTTASPPPLSIPDDLAWTSTDSVPDVPSIKLGQFAIMFETTRLSDVATATGGIVGHSGDAASSLDWVCLHQDGVDHDTRIWLTSGEIAGESVNGAQVAQLRPDSAATPSCVLIRPEHTPVSLPGLPPLGEAESEVRARLMRPSLDRDGMLAYVRIGKLPGECELWQSLDVRLTTARVTALGFTHSTFC